MKFINPKVDYAFKKIFGSHQSEKILISFLSGCIIYTVEKIIDWKHICEVSGNINHICRRKICAS